MARRYTRDARGRFSSGGGGGSRGGGSKPIQRGTNRLTRDNAGRITSQGGNGATARGGRLATASGNKRATQTAKLSGGGKPAGTVRSGVRAKPPEPRSGKVVLDESKWRRVAQRVQTRGTVRGSVEADRPGGPFNAASERRGLRAFRTQIAADQFLRNITKSKEDPQKLARGLEELNHNFRARPVRGTGSTSIGVAARNRQATEARRAKREAAKVARQSRAAVSKPAVTASRPVSRIGSIPNTIRQPRIRTQSEGDKEVRRLMRDMPTVPKGRKSDYSQGGVHSYDTSYTSPRRMSGRQISAMQSSLEKQGWSRRSDALGRQVKYSRSFNGPGGTAEIARVRVSRSGGPLASGQVEVSRLVFSRPGRRGAGGSIIESRYGLRRKPRGTTAPRRKLS